MLDRAPAFIAMSIFISIASYCDPVLGFTLARARATARWPEQLHFGIVDQSPPGSEPVHSELEPSRLTYLRIDPVYARGPCWARALAMTLYEGEEWFLQLDSHMDFDEGWDAQLIAHAQALLTGRRGIAISSYPNSFVFQEGRPVRRPATEKVLAHVVKPGSGFSPEHVVLSFEAHPAHVDEPVPGFHVGAGCLFAPGSFVEQLPYDPWFYFHGEEQGVAIRMFTHGWDIFHVPALPIYHLYNNADAGGPPRPMHWDAAHEAQRQRAWWTLEQRSRARLAALVGGQPLGVFGLGSVRSVAQYAQFSGIDYAARSIAPKAFRPLLPEPQPA
jgi:hypothetical protein